MSSWRNTILKDFVPNVAKLTLVSDLDCLLTEEKLAMELRDRGFDLIEFNDILNIQIEINKMTNALMAKLATSHSSLATNKAEQ